MSAKSDYTGPNFCTSTALDEFRWEVKTYKDARRIGVYHSFELAEKVRKDVDRRFLREHVRSLRVKQ